MRNQSAESEEGIHTWGQPHMGYGTWGQESKHVGAGRHRVSAPECDSGRNVTRQHVGKLNK